MNTNMRIDEVVSVSQLIKKLTLVLLVICFVVTPQYDVYSAESTPKSTPGEEGESGSLDVQFGLVPVGDYPDGYFADTEVAPGDTATFEIQVVNIGSMPVDLQLYTANAHNGENGGFVAGSTDEPLSEPATWIEFAPQLLSLQPNTSSTISFGVTVPENTPPGQYISALVAETTEASEIPGSEILSQLLRHAISLSIVVPGEAIFGFEIGTPVVDEYVLRIPITNTGNFLIKPAGEIEIVDNDGSILATQQIQMSSVYGGNEAYIAVYLPDQIPAGDYSLNLKLGDPESGTSASLEGVEFALISEDDAQGLQLTDATVTANAEDIAFATFNLTIQNNGEDLTAVKVTLHVMLDGEPYEEFSLANDQLLRRGEYTLESRYIPEELWQPGTYTFRIIVESVGVEGDQQIQLLNEDLDAEIVVP